MMKASKNNKSVGKPHKKMKCSRCKKIADYMKVIRVLCKECYVVENEEIVNDETDYPADHFKVLELTPEQRVKLYKGQSEENVKKFENARNLRREMSKEMRDRSEHDRGYRVGIVHGAIFIKNQFDNIQAEMWKDYDQKYGTCLGKVSCR